MHSLTPAGPVPLILPVARAVMRDREDRIHLLEGRSLGWGILVACWRLWIWPIFLVSDGPWPSWLDTVSDLSLALLPCHVPGG